MAADEARVLAPAAPTGSYLAFAGKAETLLRSGSRTVVEVPSSGEREFVGAMLLLFGFLFWLGGAGYVSLWLVFLNETWSERIGKLLMGLGVILMVSSLL